MVFPSLPRRVPIVALVASAGCLLATLHPPAPARAGATGTGAKGAEVYCFMRNNGNGHEVSWTAAYALIKRQSSGLFKTSPEHAAVMITESVVEDPGSFPDCGRYLGDLYNRHTPAGSTPTELDANPSYRTDRRAAEPDHGYTRSERYGY
jgi:hypothetical protein